MSEEYIKRGDAIKASTPAFRNAFSDWEAGWIESKDDTKDMIENLPFEDVAPVRHGRWIEYGENKDGTHNICCSVCDGFFKSKGHANSCYTRNKYRYCHNCGARMDGGIDSEKSDEDV